MRTKDKILRRISKSQNKFLEHSIREDNHDDNKYKDNPGNNRCRLYVGNLDFKTSLNELRESFAIFGEIKALHMKSGFAFVVRYNRIYFIINLLNRNSKKKKQLKKQKRN